MFRNTDFIEGAMTNFLVVNGIFSGIILHSNHSLGGYGHRFENKVFALPDGGA